MNPHDLPDLDPSMRDLLHDARDMHEPTPEVQARVLHGLEAKIAAGVTATAVTSTFLGTAKAMLAVTALGAASMGVWYVQKSEPQPAVETHRVAKVAPPVEEAAPVIEEEDDDEDAGKPHKRRVKRRHHESTSLVAETRLLKDVNAAINQRDGARAMRLLGEYDQRFGAGTLREERSAARVFALCLVDKRGSAAREAKRFESQFPRSPLLSRVLGACADGP